jgi:archaellum component FlaC
MRKRILLFGFSFALTLIATVPQVTSQVLGQPYRVSDKEVTKLLDRITKQTGTFRKSLKEALNKRRFDRTRREDDINASVKNFEEQTKRLDDNFDHHRSTTADVDSVLDRAARIDGFMSRFPLTPRAQNDWSALRANLDQLTEAYNVSWRWGGYSPEPVVSDIPYRLSDKEVEEIIHRVEKQSDRFRSSLDSALDKSRFDGTKREDDINAFVKEFYAETKRLHDHFDNHKSTGADVESVLDRAARIDDFMRRYRLSSRAQNDWSTVRTNLDELARVYNVTWRWR